MDRLPLLVAFSIGFDVALAVVLAGVLWMYRDKRSTRWPNMGGR